MGFAKFCTIFENQMIQIKFRNSIKFESPPKMDIILVSVNSSLRQERTVCFYKVLSKINKFFRTIFDKYFIGG